MTQLRAKEAGRWESDTLRLDHLRRAVLSCTMFMRSRSPLIGGAFLEIDPTRRALHPLIEEEFSKVNETGLSTNLRCC